VNKGQNVEGMKKR